MKTEFWLIATVLIIIGLVIVILPIWRKRDTEGSDVDQQNIDIARQKLSELKTQLANGNIDQAQYDIQLNELELALSDDLSLDQNASDSQKQGRWIVGLIVVFVPVVAVTLYLMLGDSRPNALLMPEKVSTIGKNTLSTKQKIGAIDEMVSGLAERLKNQPDDLQGWVMLGKSYKYLKQYEKAADAFAKANVLAGTNPDVMLQYADALVMVNQGNFTSEPKQLIFKALELAPDNPTALWLAGKAQVQEAKYPQALQYLRRAEVQLKPGSESHKIMQSYIAYVESQVPRSTITTTTALSAIPAVSVKPESGVSQVSAETGMQVKVSISAELMNLTAANDTVFIYAKAMSGPQMPLAIVRKKVSDLPLTVRLTDAQAMTPIMKLSKFQQVKLTARISKTGNAMPQAGDFIGAVNDVSVGSKLMIVINIDRTVK